MRQEGEKKVLIMKQQLADEQVKAIQREEEIKELKRYVLSLKNLQFAMYICTSRL